MANSFFEAEAERRAAHMRVARERARSSAEIRVASVVGAHGALFTSLRRGAIQTHDRLDEESLIPMFSASRNSIRSALKLLADEGLVSRAPRLGTEVVARLLDVPLDIGSGWGPDAEAGDYEIIVTDERWVAATPISQRLLHTTHSRVHQTEVIDTFHGKPCMLYTRFTLADGARRPLVTGPDDADFRELFEQTYGSPLGSVECWVEAKAASGRSAARLDVHVGTPLIVKSRVLKDAAGVPREYSISHYPASRINMSARAVGGLTSAGRDSDAPEPVADAALTRDSPSQELRRSSATTLHTELRAAIRDGLVRLGEELDEEALAVSFATSRATVREALTHLAKEGILRRSRDAGAVVSSPISRFSLASGRPYEAAEQSQFQSEVLSSARVPVPPFLSGVLTSDTGRVHRDEHVSYRAGKPIMIFVRYSDGTLAAPRPLTSETGDADFASLFRRSYGLSPGVIESWVHAIRADEQIARRLDVAPGTVVLLLERLTHDSLGTVRELSHSYILAGSVSLQIHQDVHQDRVPA